MKTLLPLAVAAAATFAASPAGAHSIHISDDGGYRISIPYGDLNLASPAGARTLQGRLKAASRAACGGTPKVMGLAEARAFETCRRNVLEVARPKLSLALEPRDSGNIALAARR